MVTLGQIRAGAMALPVENRRMPGEELLETNLSAEELADMEKTWDDEAGRRIANYRAALTTRILARPPCLRAASVPTSAP